MYLKNNLMMLLCLGVFTSCESFDEKQTEQEKQTAHYVFNLSYEQTDFSAKTRGTSLSSQVKNIYIYDFIDDNLYQCVKQSSSDANFGSLDINLCYNKHKLLFCASKANVTSLENGLYSFDKVSDTFISANDVNVSDEPDKKTMSVSLSRAVAGIVFEASDTVPSNVSKISFVINGASITLNGFTGKGGTVCVQDKGISLGTEYVGKKNLRFNNYLFLPENVTKVNVTAYAYSSDGNILYSRVFSDVPVTVNKLTVCKTKLFTNDVLFSPEIVSEWNDSTVIKF